MTTERLAGRVTMDTAADTITINTRVFGVVWTGATATHVLLLDDQDGKEIVGAVAETNNTERFWNFGPQGIPVTKLTVTTLGGGRIVIYTS